MAQQSSSADYFGSFLSKVAETEAVPPPDASAAVQHRLLTMLASAPEPRSIRSLLADVGVPPTQLVQTLHMLAEANLITMSGVDNDTVQITDLGRKLS